MSVSCSINYGHSFTTISIVRMCSFFGMEVNMNGYLKISEIAEKWGIKERRINTLCQEGRIEGAVKFGNTWAIPEDAEKPRDERIKSGKYIEWRKDNKNDKKCHWNNVYLFIF